MIYTLASTRTAVARIIYRAWSQPGVEDGNFTSESISKMSLPPLI